MMVMTAVRPTTVRPAAAALRFLRRANSFPGGSRGQDDLRRLVLSRPISLHFRPPLPRGVGPSPGSGAGGNGGRRRLAVAVAAGAAMLVSAGWASAQSGGGVGGPYGFPGGWIPRLYADAPAPGPPGEDELKVEAGAVRVDPTTLLPFPSVLRLSSSSAFSDPLTLVGLGVRTVSFLSVRVYVAGFYVDEDKFKERVKSLEGWRNYDATRLLSYPSSDGKADDRPTSDDDSSVVRGEALVKGLIDAGVPMAMRIVPVRSTDWQHLRDGWMRAVQGRIKKAKAKGELDEKGEEALGPALQSLKSIFPKGAVPKGKAFVLVLRPSPSPSPSRSATTALLGASSSSASNPQEPSKPKLTIEYEGKELGTVEGEAPGWEGWVGKELLLAYFADEGAISPKAKQSIAHGFEEMLRVSPAGP